MGVNLVENYHKRINSINSRVVLLSIVNDFDKALNDKTITFTEANAILRSFLDHLTPPIFGLLTEREFVAIFGAVILKNEPMETVVLLIQYLSSISKDDNFKLLKIVQLINLILQENFIKIITGFNDVTTINRKQLEGNFSQTLCSFSDRIYNLYVNDPKNVSNGAKIVFEFEQILLDALKNALKNSPKFSMNFNFCTKILTDYGIVSYKFIKLFVEWILMDENLVLNEIWQNFLTNLDIDFKKREQMIIILVSIVPNGSSLKKLFNNSVLKNPFLRRILSKKLLVERISSTSTETTSQKRVSQKIAEYFSAISAPDLITETLMELLEIFSDQVLLLETVNFEQQFKLAIAILDFANKVSPEDYAKLKEEVINRLVLAVPEYLKFADNSRRQIGMFVAETLTNRLGTFSSGKFEPLKFDYVETDPIFMELKAIATANEPDSGESERKSLDKKIKPKNNPNKISLVDSRTKILDSDDDENPEGEFLEGNLTDKDFEEEMQELELDLKSGRPYYLRDCLSNLGEKENYKTFAMALRHLPKLIESKAIGLDDLAIELMEKVIYLEDKFNIPNFSELRKESLKLIFAIRPELISPALRILFSIHCNMSNRYFILSCLEAAANYLANFDRQNQTPKIEIVEKENETKKLGKIIRDFKKKVVAKTSENQFGRMAHLFIYPLMDIKQNFGQHLDLFDRDHILLGKILWTIGQLIVFAKNCHLMNRILSSLFPLLHFLRSNSHSFVTNAILFCYSSIMESVDNTLLKALFVEDLEDGFEWMAQLVQNSAKLEADPMLKQSLQVAAYKITQILQPEIL